MPITRAILMHDFTAPQQSYVIIMTFATPAAHLCFMRCYYSMRPDVHAEETFAQFKRNKSTPYRG